MTPDEIISDLQYALNASIAREQDLRTQLSAARAREAQLLTAFNFRQWTPEMDRAWHRAIPNVQKAFTDLLAAIDQARGK